MERRGPSELQPILGDDFVVRGSNGMGTAAEVPWISAFPTDSGASARQGCYVVYLFAADGSSVYISLASATESLQRVAIRKRTLDLRTAVGSQPNLVEEVDLRSSASRPKKYEDGCAFAIRYDAGSVPGTAKLVQDLHVFLSLWRTAERSGLRFAETEPMHLVLKWSPDREPETIALARGVADRLGSVWWGCLGQTDAPGMSEARVTALRNQIVQTNGQCTYAFLYRRGECWRTKILDVTADPQAVDRELLPGYFEPEECNLFLRLKEIVQLDANWPFEHLVPVANPTHEAIAGALGNQSTPLAVFERFIKDPGRVVPIPSRRAELTLEWLERETLWPADALEEVIDSLTGGSPQIVLAGPPGTSKTWIAKRIARFVTRDEPLSHRVVQFHPSYGYEEFMEGLRPVASGGGIVFSRVDGVVLDMVKQIQDEQQLHVLVMDEMNRANLPRVLGELMYLFEYRSDPVDLLYTKSFELPPNLLFLGTMNTADRSIRSIDIALRRRFDVFECPPEVGILERFYRRPGRENEVSDLLDRFVEMNSKLQALLDRHHTIGHSFFMADRMTPQRLETVWRRKIIPLLEKYFFDQPDIVTDFRVDRFWQRVTSAHPDGH